MIKRLKGYFKSLMIVSKLIKKDRLRTFHVPFKIKVSAWRNGYLPESSVIYDLAENQRPNYLSDFNRSQAASINGVNSVLLDYKHLFSHAFSKEVRIVQPDFHIVKGTPFCFGNGKPITLSEFLGDLGQDEFVFKPSGGGGGAGILFVCLSGNTCIINDQEYTESEFQALVATMNDVVVYKRIYQTGFAKVINPTSLNTIRILTMVDVDSHEAFIAIAVFRCGVKKSGAVDNWSSGGLSAKINLTTGEIGKAVTFPYNGELRWASHHPESEFQIEGTMIPHWNLIANEILRIAQQYYFIPYIAWDVVPMDNDFLILEANSNSDVNLLQVHDPLLSSPRVKKFYEHYGIV